MLTKKSAMAHEVTGQQSFNCQTSTPAVCGMLSGHAASCRWRMNTDVFPSSSLPSSSPDPVREADRFTLQQLCVEHMSADPLCQLEVEAYDHTVTTHVSKSPVNLKFSFISMPNRRSCPPARLCCAIDLLCAHRSFVFPASQ